MVNAIVAPFVREEEVSQKRKKRKGGLNMENTKLVLGRIGAECVSRPIYKVSFKDMQMLPEIQTL